MWATLYQVHCCLTLNSVGACLFVQNWQHSFRQTSQSLIKRGKGLLQPLLHRRYFIARQSMKITAAMTLLVTNSINAHHTPFTYAADHCSRSGGWVRMAAFVNSLSMSGSSGGMRICSALYMGPAELGSMLKKIESHVRLFVAMVMLGLVHVIRSRERHMSNCARRGSCYISTFEAYV